MEVAHEALIRHWSRLTEWLNEDRDNLRLREGVSESAREWENSKRDDSLLNHRGGRLELALAMSKLPHYQLNPIEQAYLNACVALRNREQRERERRLRWTVTASIAVAVIFLILGSFGWVKSNEATNQAKIALARQLASQAQYIDNPKLTDLLFIESMKLFPTIEAAQTLIRRNLRVNRMTHNGAVILATFSPDGKYLISGSADGVIHIWATATGYEVARINHDGSWKILALSPDRNM